MLAGLLAAVLLVVLQQHQASAIQYVFRAERCNTNFNNLDNWAQGKSPVMPEGDSSWQPPRNVQLYDPSSPREVTSLVAPGTYEATTLEFGPQTTLVLSGDGVVFTFRPPEAAGDYDATFVAGQKVKKECDMGCSENYVIGGISSAQNYKPETMTPATSVPCSADTVFFPLGYMSKVFAYSSYDLSRINIDGKNYGDTTSFKARTTGTVRFVPAEPDIRVGDVQTCKEENLFDSSKGECVCFDSCSAQPQDLSTLAEAAQVASSQAVMDQTKTARFTVSYTYDLASTALADHADCLATAAKAEVLRGHLSHFAGVRDINLTLSQTSASTLSISATVDAQEAGFQHQADTFAFSGANQPTLPSSPAASPRIDFVLYIWAKLIETAGDCLDDACYEDANQATCGGQPCATVFGPLYTLSWPTYNLKRNLALFNSGDFNSMHVHRCANADTSATCKSSLDVIKAFMSPPRDFSAYSTYLATLEQCGVESDSFESAVTQPPLTAGTVTGFFGRDLMQAHVVMLLDENNIHPYANHVASGVRGFGRIIHSNRSSLFQSLRLGFPVLARRRNADQANFFGRASRLISMSVDYSLYGSDLTADEKAELIAWIEHLTNTYKPTTHACFVWETASFSPSCIAGVLANAVKAGCTTQQCLRETALAIIGCGLAGADSDGNCLDPAEQAANINLANTLASQAQGGSTSSSSSIVPIAAGAAAGALLIIIIVVVVVLRRGSNKGSAVHGAQGGAKSDRTVVAFENPMYDDPATTDVAQSALYDSTYHDGLYDEPAFNQGQGKQSTKDNPMYQSADDLADPASAEMEEGGGYLDVAPDQDE